MKKSNYALKLIQQLYQIEREANEGELFVELTQAELSKATEKMILLERAYDSLLMVMTKATKSGVSYSIVLESQLDLERGLAGLDQMQQSLYNNLKLVISKSGKWHYIVYMYAVSAEELEFKPF